MAIEDEIEELIKPYWGFNTKIAYLSATDPDYNISEDVLAELIKRGYKNRLIDANEKILLKVVNGKTILESLLDENLSPIFNGVFTSEEILKILLKYNRIDLAMKLSPDLLINKPTPDKNYLEYFLENYRDYFLDNYKTYFLAKYNEANARLYILMAKKNLSGKLPKLDLVFGPNAATEKDLNGNCFLYYLITFDKDLAMKYYINSNVKKDPTTYASLLEYGIDISLIDVPVPELDCAKAYTSAHNLEYSRGITSPVENLLEEFRILFASDGHSSMEVIETLISAYRYSTSVNPVAIEELKTLINVKKANPEFYYLLGNYSNDRCDPETGNVEVSSLQMQMILHETGHALHFHTTHMSVPDKFADVLARIKNDPGFIKRVDEFSRQYLLVKEQTEERARIISEKMVDEFVATNGDRIPSLLEQGKRKAIESIIEWDPYSNEGELEPSLSPLFTREKFIRDKKEIEKRNLIDVMNNLDNYIWTQIGDILNSICDAKISRNALFNDKGEVIPPCPDIHTSFDDQDGFAPRSTQFSEMIAQYSVLIKSPKATEAIQILRYLVGDELVDMLDEFYKTSILNQSYENEPAQR